MRQVAMGTMLYAANNKDQVPCIPYNTTVNYEYTGLSGPGSFTYRYGPASSGGGAPLFAYSAAYAAYGLWYDLRPYKVTANVSKCPSDNTRWGSNFSIQGSWSLPWPGYGSAAALAGVQADINFASSYYMPYWIRNGASSPDGMTPQGKAWKLSQIKPSSKKILLVESTPPATDNSGTSAAYHPYQQSIHSKNGSAVVGKPAGVGRAVFADGHVEAYEISRIRGRTFAFGNVYHSIDDFNRYFPLPMKADID